MKEEKLSVSVLENVQTSGAGYDVLRYIGLADLLGTEKDTIIYFMGKNMARKFAITTLGDVIYFFDQMGWGKLELMKEKRNRVLFSLLADSVAQRLHTKIKTDFLMEAGFLAEAMQQLKEIECECTVKTHDRIGKVEFTVFYTE
ncbi:MAG TPA: YslB family protein [Cerasibacillus sp.]|uniref:YslB family protein n=1 Tax=Cerasibacillus sp. TaxID=2498711 RepID=UPI002F3EEF07